MWKFFDILYREMNEWYRLAPVSLTRKKPIAEFVVYFFVSETFDLGFFCENLSSFSGSESVEFSRIHENPIIYQRMTKEGMSDSECEVLMNFDIFELF